MRQPRPWATSWRRYDKTHHLKAAQRTGWEAELPCRCAAFFTRVGHGVGQIFLLSESYNFLHSKTPRKQQVSGRFVELVG